LLPNHLGVNAQVLLPAMVDHLASLPRVSFRANELVVDVRTEMGGVKLKTAKGGVVRGDRVVVCSGSEVQSLFPGVLAESGLEAVKLNMMEVTPQPPERQLPFHLMGGWSLRRYPAFQQCASYSQLSQEPLPSDVQAGGLHVLMTQPQTKGPWLLGDSHHFYPLQGAAADANWRDHKLDQRLLEEAQRMTGAAGFSVQRSWTGWYLRHPRQPWWLQNVDERTTLVTGLSGRGMTLAPGLAQNLLNELLEAPY
jgi:FAD dependent oxidoreductase.